MIFILAFIIDWNSYIGVSKWTIIFDYAAIFDLVAAILLFVVSKWKLKGKAAKKTTHASELVAVLAAVIWIIDIKLNHRLSALQQIESDAQISQLTNSLAKTELARKQAQEAAEKAVNSANSLNMEALQNLPRHLSIEQQNKLLMAIREFPNGHLSFSVPQGVEDAQGIAEDIAAVFISDGWQLFPGRGGILVGLGNGIIVNGDKSNAATVKAVADTLTSFGLNGQQETGRWLYRNDIKTIGFSNVVNIIIGYKTEK